MISEIHIYTINAAVAAAGVKLGGNVAKMEVREAESAFA